MENRIKDFADNCWKDFFYEIKNSVVYIDSGASECLHWYTGDKTIHRLRHAGALTVRELSTRNIKDVSVEGARRATFVCTSADPDFYTNTLQRIVAANRFYSCTIICAAHSSVLEYSSNYDNDPRSSYDVLKDDVVNWIRLKMRGESNQEPEVKIIFRPIFTALINENLFVTPPFSRLVPQLDDEYISENFEAELNHFVSSMHSMFTNFNVREDIFFIGNLSENVAEKLDKLPAAVERRKRLTGKAGISLVLVDRTLDLCVATSHNTDSLLGKMLSTLPRLPDHHNDVAVNMTALCPDGDGGENYSKYCAPGCLASNDSNMMNLFIKHKQKDVLLTLHKLLADISLAKESPKTRITTRITAYSLEKLVQKFGSAEDLRHVVNSSKKLQQILAVIQALKSNKTAQIELMISLEKLILQNLAVSRDSSSILAQLSNIIKTRATRGLSVENLLGLLIHIYALAGTEIRLPEQQEKQVEEALAEAIREDFKVSDNPVPGSDTSSKLFCKGETSQEESLKIASRTVKELHKIAGMRKSLHKYKSLMLKPSPQEMAQCVGILEQLVTDLLDPTKPEIPDLRCKTLSRVAAGFNLLLKGKTQRHPTDNECLIIYVLGGVVAEEIKILQDIISSRKSNCHVILAGSRLLSPADVTNDILLSRINAS